MLIEKKKARAIFVLCIAWTHCLFFSSLWRIDVSLFEVRKVGIL